MRVSTDESTLLSQLQPETDTGRKRSPWPPDRFGLVLGPLVLIAWIRFVDPGTLTPEAHRLAGIMWLTIVWWITEPIPIAATGLLAVVLTVVLGAVPHELQPTEVARTVLAPFADPSVFFLLGGLFIGRAMARHGLDRRVALSILCTRWAGRSPTTVLTSVGLSVMLISMWISNTAATAMMYPVTIGIITVLGAGTRSRQPDDRRGPDTAAPAPGVAAPGDATAAANQSGTPTGSLQTADSDTRFHHSPYASALLLVTAYASSIGGIATPIGTATNVVALGFFKRPEYFGRPPDFLRWSVVGVPIMLLIFIGLVAWVGGRSRPRTLNMADLRDYLHRERARLGPWKTGELSTLVVFVMVVCLWVTPGVLALVGAMQARDAIASRFPEEITALLAPVLLFLIPADWKRRQGTIDASDLSRIDWGTILLFGSGLSLGNLMFRTGLAQAAAQYVFDWLGTHDIWILTAVAIFGGILLSEFTSNAAAAATLIPVTMAICREAQVDALAPLLGVTFGASFGSALPVSTPPNAIVYSSGLLPVGRMIRAGVVLDLVAAVAAWIVLRLAGLFHWSVFS